MSAPDRARPGEQAQLYGAGTSVLAWRDRLVCSRCGSREIDMVLTGARSDLAAAALPPTYPWPSPRQPFAIAGSRRYRVRHRRAGQCDL